MFREECTIGGGGGYRRIYFQLSAKINLPVFVYCTGDILNTLRVSEGRVLRKNLGLRGRK
jgi:hypothetical protein